MPAGKTYEPIATVTASGSSLYLEATNIPATYTDLIVVLSLKQSGQDGLNLQVGNGSFDTGSNYSVTVVRGSGTAASSYRLSSQAFVQVGLESNEWGNLILQINNYSNTNTYKSFLSRSNTPNWLLEATVGLWRSTSAIERIRIYNGGSANHAAGSTMTLYGIKAA